jgi:iron complex outermembrane receptor protein
MPRFIRDIEHPPSQIDPNEPQSDQENIMPLSSFKQHKIAASVALAILPTLGSGHLAAQNTLVLEETIVTARKRTESLQDIPLSISTLGYEEIERLGVSRTVDVAKLTPGLTFNRGIGGSDIRPDIRGITQLSGRSNVAILIDGVDQTTDALTGTGAGQLVGMGLYDLERIEVVKGPQSALFGRNAFGGAISYITKRPSEEFEGRAELDAAEYGTYRGKIGLSGPINDQFLYRVNYAHDETDGYYKHPETRKKLGKNETDSISLALQWLPNDKLSNLSRLDYSDQDSGQNAIANAPYNKCEEIRGKANPTPFADGTSTIVDGGCEFQSFVGPDFSNFPDVTFGEDVPLYLGDLPDKVGESDIRLSPVGVRGISNEVTMFNNLLEWEANSNYLFVSNTAFIHHEGRDNYDLDQQGTATTVQNLSQAGLSFPWISTENPLNFQFDSDFDRDVTFQDLHLTFDSGETVQWLLGGEYYYEDYDQKSYQRANQSVNRNDPSPTATGRVLTGLWVDETGTIAAPDFEFSDATITGSLPQKERRKTEVGSVYGSFDWNFAPKWNLNLSGRYQRETVKVNYTAQDATYLVPAYQDQKAGAFYPSVPSSEIAVCPGPVSPTGVLCAIGSEPLNTGPRETSGKETFNTFNPRAALTLQQNDDLMFYGSVAKGTKPGGFNFNANLTDSNQAYDQEELIAYELGWKSTLQDGRTQFNGTFFYNDNTDKQANDIQYGEAGGAPEQFVNNIGKVESYGAELRLTTSLTQNLFFDINYVYTHTEIKSYEQARRPDGDAQADLEGEKLPWTPEHSALGTLRYERDLSGDYSLISRWDTRYMSERNAVLEGEVQFEPITISDFQVGITTDKLEIIAYVDNVFDDRTPENGVAFVNFFQAFQDLMVVYPQDRRTFGVRTSYRF